MPKLYSSKQIAAFLVRFGFGLVSQKGSHGKFKNTEGRIVIVPMGKREIPEGTLRSILKQADLTKDDIGELS